MDHPSCTSAETDERAHDAHGAGHGPVATGSTCEAIAGGGAIVLPILGLLGLYPSLLTAIATIVAGGGLLIEGGALAAGAAAAARGGAAATPSHGLVRGVGMEIAAGIAAIVLGILALVGLAPTLLVAIAVTALGGAELIGAGAADHRVRLTDPRSGPRRPMANAFGASFAYGAQVLGGLGATIIGIIVLTGASSESTSKLLLVALLCLGGGMLLGGATVAATSGARLRHATA